MTKVEEFRYSRVPASVRLVISVKRIAREHSNLNLKYQARKSEHPTQIILSSSDQRPLHHTARHAATTLPTLRLEVPRDQVGDPPVNCTTHAPQLPRAAVPRLLRRLEGSATEHQPGERRWPGAGERGGRAGQSRGGGRDERSGFGAGDAGAGGTSPHLDPSAPSGDEGTRRRLLIADDDSQILKRDPEFAEQAPEVLKQELKQDAQGAEEAADTSFDNLLALGQMEAIAHGGFASDVTESMVGHKFPLPELPLPPFSNRKERYDTVVDQVTNLIMKDGKLSVAQRVSL